MKLIFDTDYLPSRYEVVANSKQNQIPAERKGECKDTLILIPDMQIPN